MVETGATQTDRVETNKQIKSRIKAPWNVNQGWVKGSKDGEQRVKNQKSSWKIKHERTCLKFGFKYQVNRCWRSF